MNNETKADVIANIIVDYNSEQFRDKKKHMDLLVSLYDKYAPQFQSPQPKEQLSQYGNVLAYDKQKLFDYMSKEHGVTLLSQDMQEIENIICPKTYPYSASNVPEIDYEQLKLEINHILDSGANDIRLIEMFERFISKIKPVKSNVPVDSRKVIMDFMMWHSGNENMSNNEEISEIVDIYLGDVPSRENNILSMPIGLASEWFQDLRNKSKNQSNVPSQYFNKAYEKLILSAQHLFDMKKQKGSTSVMKNAWNILAVALFDAKKEYKNQSNVLVQDLEKEEDKPKVVCVCGSTRFAELFMITRWELEKQGTITFGINILPDNYFAESNSHGAEQEGVKEILDELHKRKIDLSDEVFILNVGGYIGESTKSELEYAKSLNKTIKFYEED